MSRFWRITGTTVSFVTLLMFASASQALVVHTSYLFDASVTATAGPTELNNVVVTEQNGSRIFLRGFDSLLGTLKSVRVTFDSVFNLSGNLQITDPDRCFFCEEDVEGNGFVGNAVGVGVYVNPNSYVRADEVARVGFACDGEDGRCVSQGNSGPQSFGGTLLDTSDATILSTFIDSTAVFDANNTLSAVVNLCRDDEDLCTVFGRSDFSGSVSIFYTYDAPVAEPVPEPASLTLLGLCVAGLALCRRRKTTRMRSILR